MRELDENTGKNDKMVVIQWKKSCNKSLHCDTYTFIVIVVIDVGWRVSGLIDVTWGLLDNHQSSQY